MILLLIILAESRTTSNKPKERQKQNDMKYNTHCSHSPILKLIALPKEAPKFFLVATDSEKFPRTLLCYTTPNNGVF
jgi:hypothetical protein